MVLSINSSDSQSNREINVVIFVHQQRIGEDNPDLLLEEVGTMNLQSQMSPFPVNERENDRRHLARGLSCSTDDLSLITMSYWGEDKQTLGTTDHSQGPR